MVPLKNIAFIVSTLLTLVSCGGATHNLGSGTFSENNSYKVNSYYGCCGCYAKYFTLYSGKRKIEQIVYDYNCPRNDLPTKFIFNYDQAGTLINCDRYIATTKNDFTDTLTENDKKVIGLLISDSASIKYGFTSVNFILVKGFRKPNINEAIQPFPLIKRGYKVKQI